MSEEVTRPTAQSGGSSIHEEQRSRWSNAAQFWDEHREHISGNTRPVTEQILEMLDPRAGEHILDLASGVGDPAIRIAELVGPEGYVLGLDITSDMLAAARSRAETMGLRNIEFRTIASETQLGVPSGSFHAATCRFGLMFMPSATDALSAVRNALQEEGRIAVATWGPSEQNDWARLWPAIVAKHVQVPPLLTATPQWSAVSTIDGLEGALLEAGFEDVQTVSVEVVAARGETPADLWDTQTTLGVALREALSSLSVELRNTIRDDAIRTLSEMFGNGPVTLTAEALVSLGINPGEATA